MFRWLRKKAIPFYGVNKDIMNILLQLKKRSRLMKYGQEKTFDSFVIGEELVSDFFSTLNANLQDFANKTRFQLTIQSKNHHYWMVDCYIRDGILHTLTLDAAVVLPSLNPMLKSLSDSVPNGKHNVFYIGDDIGKRIQRSFIDCQIFTPEHLSVVTRIDPDELYDSFNHGEHLRECILDGETSPRENLKFFGTNTVNEKHSILAPIFRCMQSVSTLDSLPDAFKDTIVSKKSSDTGEGVTLDQWMEKNVKHTPDGYKNLAIYAKKENYLREINQCQTTFFNDRTGFGFISFPILTKVKQRLLSSPIEACYQMTQDLKTFLAAQTIEKNSFLNLRSAATKQLDKTIAKLDNLYQNRSTLDQAHYILNFTDIIYKYAKFLDQNKITPAMTSLNNFFAENHNHDIGNSNNNNQPNLTSF